MTWESCSDSILWWKTLKSKQELQNDTAQGKIYAYQRQLGTKDFLLNLWHREFRVPYKRGRWRAPKTSRGTFYRGPLVQPWGTLHGDFWREILWAQTSVPPVHKEIDSDPLVRRRMKHFMYYELVFQIQCRASEKHISAHQHPLLKASWQSTTFRQPVPYQLSFPESHHSH